MANLDSRRSRNHDIKNAYLYNVFEDGKMIMSDSSTADIVKALGVNRRKISYCARTGHILDGKYTVDYAEGYSYKPVKPKLDSGEKTQEEKFIKQYGIKNYLQWQELNRRYGGRNGKA